MGGQEKPDNAYTDAHNTATQFDDTQCLLPTEVMADFPLPLGYVSTIYTNAV